MVTSDTSSSIKILPEHLIDQIKAGEVIERPVNILKELIENSIDSGATSIAIQIEGNGLDLISITDNGCGMSYNELPFAFSRHATSKIERFEDLYNLNNFGFRGEALASIASICKVTCSSNTIRNDGGSIKFEGSKQAAYYQNDSLPQGTSIFIKDLFYNTPARLKFLKSKKSESNTIKKVLNGFIISNPSIEISIEWENKSKQRYIKGDRIDQLFFSGKNSQQIDKTIIHFKNDHDDHIVEGYIGHHSSKGNMGKHQYIFANNRMITDQKIHYIVKSHMQRVWSDGETGNYSIFLNIPTEQIDVNVHPCKTTVKFYQGPMIYALLSSTIKSTIPISANSSTDQSNQIDLPSTYDSPIFKDLKTQGNRSFLNRSFNSDIEEEQSNSGIQIIHMFDKNKVLAKCNNQLYVIDVNALFAYYFQNEYNKISLPLEDDNMSPLLVSAPFPIKSPEIDNYFDDLKFYGFECDRLDEALVVLRTIPIFFNLVPYREIVSQLLSFLANNKLDTTDNFKEIIQQFFHHEMKLLPIISSPNDIRRIYDGLDITKMISEGIIKEISEDDLKIKK